MRTATKHVCTATVTTVPGMRCNLKWGPWLFAAAVPPICETIQPCCLRCLSIALSEFWAETSGITYLYCT